MIQATITPIQTMQMSQTYNNVCTHMNIYILLPLTYNHRIRIMHSLEPIKLIKRAKSRLVKLRSQYLL